MATRKKEKGASFDSRPQRGSNVRTPELRKRIYRFEQLRAKKNIRSEFLFAGFRDMKWEKRNSTTSLHLLLRKLGLPRFGWHRLRGTFATNYLRQGGDIVRLSMVLGHTQITTTQRCLHLLTEDLSASHQKVSILNRLSASPAAVSSDEQNHFLRFSDQHRELKRNGRRGIGSLTA